MRYAPTRIYCKQVGQVFPRPAYFILMLSCPRFWIPGQARMTNQLIVAVPDVQAYNYNYFNR